MSVTRLPAGIEMRKCPGCGYLESQKLIEMANFDNSCPRCGKYKESEFVPDIPPKPTTPGGRKRLKRAA